MVSKSNKNRLIIVATLVMSMFMAIFALGACSQTPASNPTPTAESQKEADEAQDKAAEAEDKAAKEEEKAAEAEKAAAEAEKKAAEAETEAAKTEEAAAQAEDKAAEAQDETNAEAEAAKSDSAAEEKTTDKADDTKKSDNKADEAQAEDKKADEGATDEEASASASAAASTTQTSWGEGLDCATCHTKVADSLENDKCLISQHTTLECTSCHGDATLADVHANVSIDDRMPSSLRASVVDTTTCEGCHAPDTLVDTTADSTILTDDNDTVVNPHDLPDVTEHAEVTCVSCHKMHSKTGIEKSASRACQSCHHTNVYECGTCHAA